MNGRNVFGSKITLKVVWWVLKRIVASPPKTPVNCRQVAPEQLARYCVRPAFVPQQQRPAVSIRSRRRVPPPPPMVRGGGKLHTARTVTPPRGVSVRYFQPARRTGGENGRGPSRTRRTHAAAIYYIQRRQLTGHVVSHVVYVVRPDVSGADQHVRFAQQRREAVHVGVGDATVPAAFVAHVVHDLWAQGPAKAVTGFARRRAQQHDVITVVVVEYPNRRRSRPIRRFVVVRLYERAAETGAKTRVCLRRRTANRWTFGDVRCDQWPDERW